MKDASRSMSALRGAANSIASRAPAEPLSGEEERAQCMMLTGQTCDKRRKAFQLAVVIEDGLCILECKEGIAWDV